MAARSLQSAIEEVKARIDLADLVASYGVNVRRTGADAVCCCPFHHEKTPSFHVHSVRGFYHCFGCGESGDAIKFVQKYEGLVFMDALRKLAHMAGVEIAEREDDPQAGLRSRVYALLAELAAFYNRCLMRAKEAEPARAYLESRRLTDEMVSAFCIGYAPWGAVPILKWAKKHGFTLEELYAAGALRPPRSAGDRPYHAFQGRLMFTICDRQGRPVAFSGRLLEADRKVAKYVNSPETIVFKKSRILFGLDKAARHIVKARGREVIVCEGQIDLIRCHFSGFANTVASQGTAFTADHVAILKKLADSVVLVFDADGAGQKAAIRTGGEFLSVGMPVRVATLPPGEDPDSMLRDNGPEAFRKMLDDAESVTRFQVRSLRAREEHPETIDAVTRIGRQALATIAPCPDAIVRSRLLQDAAEDLGVPQSALEEELARIGTSPRPAPAASSRPAQSAPSSRPAAPAAPATPFDDGPPPEFIEGVDDRLFEEEPPPDFDERNGEDDARSPANNPPTEREFAFCEFLFDHERDASFLPTVDFFVSPSLPLHEFTFAFVDAWKAGIRDGADALAALRDGLSPVERGWLDGRILNSDERASMSELPPERILKNFLRDFWVSAYERRRGMLPAESTPENDARRMRCSATVRRLKALPWEAASALMNDESLGAV